MDNLKSLLKELSQAVDTKKDTEGMLKAFEAVVQIALQIKKSNEADRADIESKFEDAVQNLNDKIDQRLATLQHGKDGHTPTSEELLALITPLIPEVEDGEDADEARIIASIISQLPDQFEPDTADDIRNKLELLEGDERLDKSAVRGIDQIEEDIRQIRVSPRGGLGGSKGFMLLVGGKKKKFTAQSINFVAGTNVTLTYSDAQGRNDITINASGSGLTLLTATGTVNGNNAAFTFVSQPTYIVSDGAYYRLNHGWTWNSGTSTATLTIPPTFDIWGF